jgi:hypothetical protein
MIRLSIPNAPSDRHYQIERTVGDPPVSIGRSGERADLWCGDYPWISEIAARLVHSRHHWWLLNPQGATAVRFLSNAATVDLVVASGGSTPLPPVSGRLWLSQSDVGAQHSVVVLLEVVDEASQDVDDFMAETLPGRGTLTIRPRDEATLDILAASTWHRRRATGYRLLTLREIGAYLGLGEDNVRAKLREYRHWLSENHSFFPFTGGHHGPEEVANIALDHRLVTAFDDERLQARYGVPEYSEPGA